MRVLLCAEIIVVFMIGTGCAHYGALEEDYGKSYNMAKYGQILNPRATKNLEPVMGLKGTAAQEAMRKYTDSFSKGCDKPAQQSFTVAPMTPAGATGTGQDVYGK